MYSNARYDQSLQLIAEESPGADAPLFAYSFDDIAPTSNTTPLAMAQPLMPALFSSPRQLDSPEVNQPWNMVKVDNSQPWEATFEVKAEDLDFPALWATAPLCRVGGDGFSVAGPAQFLHHPIHTTLPYHPYGHDALHEPLATALTVEHAYIQRAHPFAVSTTWSELSSTPSSDVETSRSYDSGPSSPSSCGEPDAKREDSPSFCLSPSEYKRTVKPRGHKRRPSTVIDPNVSRNFVCDICSSGFFRKHDAERHRRSHTGERPYACLGGCNKAFRRADARGRHWQTYPHCEAAHSQAIQDTVEGKKRERRKMKAEQRQQLLSSGIAAQRIERLLKRL